MSVIFEGLKVNILCWSEHIVNCSGNIKKKMFMMDDKMCTTLPFGLFIQILFGDVDMECFSSKFKNNFLLQSQ